MELDELKQGLQDIQGAAPAAEAPVQPWLGMDNLMGSYGGWFGNDKGLGELLLGQLRARGVDTQAATEAMLREILTGLTDDLNLLQQKLTGFTQAVSQQMQEISAVKDSVDTALAESGATPVSQDVGGPAGADMAVGEEPVPDMGAGTPPEAAGMPPEGGEEMPPAPEGESGDAPVPEEGAEQEEPPAPPEEGEEPAPEGTPSDKRIKKIKGYVLSDKGMKKVLGSLSKPKGMTFSMDAINAARRFSND